MMTYSIPTWWENHRLDIQHDDGYDSVDGDGDDNGGDDMMRKWRWWWLCTALTWWGYCMPA